MRQGEQQVGRCRIACETKEQWFWLPRFVPDALRGSAGGGFCVQVVRVGARGSCRLLCCVWGWGGPGPSRGISAKVSPGVERAWDGLWSVLTEI